MENINLHILNRRAQIILWIEVILEMFQRQVKIIQNKQ